MSKLRRVTLLAPIPGLGWVLDRFGGGPHVVHVPSPPAEPLAHTPDITDLGGSPVAHPGITDLGGNPIPHPGLDAVPTHGHLAARAKQHVAELFHRTANADLTTGIQIAAGSGGGRVATLGAIVGFCLSGIGAGTVCVVTGVVPDPFDLLRPHPVHRAARHAPSPPSLGRELASVRAQPRATPTPSAGRRPSHHRRERSRPAPQADPAQGTTPTSHRHAPISPAPPAAPTEFAAAPAAGAGTQPPPAAAPATGGEEFGP
jgi:hypothetical protein